MKDIGEVLNQLDRATAQIPVDQLITELQIVVERISFSRPGQRQQGQSNEISIAQINMLLQDEVSPEMLSYVQWMRENRLLLTLADTNGLLFLNHCIKKYKQLTQVRFITPVPISEGLKAHVTQSLVTAYPSGTRLIFETNSSLLAGFVIDDGTNTINRSLKNASLSTLKRRVAQSVGGAVHG